MYIFFFNDTATTEIYTLSLHDALPISRKAEAMTQALLSELQGLREDHQRAVNPPDFADLWERLKRIEALSAASRQGQAEVEADRKSTRLNSSHANISYAVFCLNKKN